MKKIAYLIMAHHDFEQLARLVMALDDERFDLYIHLDRKSQIDTSQIKGLKLAQGKLELMPFRKKIYWGDYSIVEATFAMYRYAMKKGEYTRLVTLSGNDYPIKSNDYIYNKLTTTDTEFISGQKLWPESEHYRVRHYHFFKPYFLNWIDLVKNYLRKNQIKKPMKIDSKFGIYDVFHASQWHALTPECVRYILDVAAKEPKFRKYFYYSWAPDELMIATILFHSPYAEKTIEYNREKPKTFDDLSVLTYLEYNPQDGSTVNLLDIKDYEKIVRSDRLFFRKAVSGKSEGLIEMIDKYRKDN